MEQIGNYLVEGELGRGGMGVVYRAREPQLGRHVAIKLLLGNEGSRRFELEAERLAALQHPGIVAIHDAGRDARGRPYFVMELVEGEALDQRLKREGALPPAEVRDLGLALCQALAYAHAQGILHRDLKPANVFQTPDGRVKIGDFGLSQELSETRERLTRSGTIVGTPAYLPPEQAGDDAGVDQRSDVYGLGATLYTLLAGRPPFQGSSTLNVIAKVLREPPSPLPPETPPDLAALVLRCLEKDRPARYPSAEALGEALEALTLGGASRRRPLAIAAAALCLALALLAALLTSVLRARDARERLAQGPTPATEPAASPSPEAEPEPTRLANFDAETSTTRLWVLPGFRLLSSDRRNGARGRTILWRLRGERWRQVRAWETRTGSTAHAPGSEVFWAVSTDAREVLGFHVDEAAPRWRFAAPKALPDREALACLAVSASGERLAAISQSSVFVRDLTREDASWVTGSEPFQVLLTPTGSLRQGTRQVRFSAPPPPGETEALPEVVFVTGGSTEMDRREDNRLRMYDAATGELRARALAQHPRPQAIASRGDRVYVSTSAGHVYVYRRGPTSLEFLREESPAAKESATFMRQAHPDHSIEVVQAFPSGELLTLQSEWRGHSEISSFAGRDPLDLPSRVVADSTLSETGALTMRAYWCDVTFDVDHEPWLALAILGYRNKPGRAELRPLRARLPKLAERLKAWSLARAGQPAPANDPRAGD